MESLNRICSPFKIPKVFFEPGIFLSMPAIVRKTGRNFLIVTGEKFLDSSGKWDTLLKSFHQRHLTVFHHRVSQEPSPEIIDRAVRAHKQHNIAAVIAIGGGSVLDAGKAISAMLPLNSPVINYLEGVGTQLSHPGIKLPFIAVPTTAGTGSEATSNAVISRIGTDGFKKSLRHENFVPDIAIIDPELMLSCPKNISAACGMDALCQLLESYVSTKSTPATDTLAYLGLVKIKEALIPVCTNQPDNIQLRSALAYAAFISGVTLTRAGLGLVHGFASSIGGRYSIPHGVICGTLLAPVTSITIEKLKEKQPEHPALKKYANIGNLFSPQGSKTTEEHCAALIEILKEWTQLLSIPSLKTYGIQPEDTEAIVQTTDNKNNPINLSQQEMKTILVSRL